MFALSLTIYEIFANKKNGNFDLENEGQDQEVAKRGLRHSARNVQVHIGDFFSEIYLCKR